MTRKIIQIAVTHEYRGRPICIVALCDDGSLWQLPDSCPWQKLSDIPQTEPCELQAMSYEPDLELTDEADF